MRTLRPTVMAQAAVLGDRALLGMIVDLSQDARCVGRLAQASRPTPEVAAKATQTQARASMLAQDTLPSSHGDRFTLHSRG